MIEAVFWDVDGTLVDSEPNHARALKQVIEDLGHAPPVDLAERILGEAAEDTFAWARAAFDLQIGFLEWIARKYRTYLELSHDIEPIAPAVALWDELRARGVKQAIVSNADRMLLEANLRVLGRVKPRDVTLSKNDVIHGKPHPEPYLRAAHLCGVAPENCLVLEDSLPGAQAGLAAGMRTFFVPHAPKKDLQGVQVLVSFEEVYDLL